MSNGYWKGPHREGAIRLPFRDAEYTPDDGPPIPLGELLKGDEASHWSWDSKTRKWVRS